MKLESNAPVIERSAPMVEQSFSIDISNPMAFQTLREYIYSNPIRTIAREIPSNARDVQREFGNAQKPIVIQIPNSLDNTYAVRDFGVGISPERMETVFIKYFSSTKRSDNNQTGGFGLGAKSPFAYSDSFNIETITPDENGVMIKRSYSAYIDESEIGKIALLSEEPTDEPRGTRISLPVETKDFDSFIRETAESLCYWTPLPEIKGYDGNLFDVSKLEMDFASDNWEVCTNHFGNNFVLIDQIKYELDINELEFPHDLPPFRQFCRNSSFKISFGGGEIPVTASREKLNYTQKAKDKILEVMLKSYIYVTENINVQITSAPDYFSALELWKKYRQGSAKSYLEKGVKWHGEELSTDISISNFGSIYQYRLANHGKKKLDTTSCYQIDTNKTTTAWVINNLPDRMNLNRNKILHLLEDSGFKTVQLINHNEKVTLADFHKLMPSISKHFRLASEVPSKKYARAPRSPNGNANKRLKVWTGGSYDKFRAAVSYTTVDIATGKGIYVIAKNNTCFLKENHEIDTYTMGSISSIISACGERLYIINPNEEKHLGKGFIKLWDKLEELAKQNTVDAIDHKNNLSCVSRRIFQDLKGKSLKVDKDSLIHQYFTLSCQNEYNKKDRTMNDLFGVNVIKSLFKDKVVINDKLAALREEFCKSYPFYDFYDRSYDEKVRTEYEWYFNQKKG